MKNPEIEFAELPLEDHPKAISDALDQLEADLDKVHAQPKADRDGTPAS